MKTTSYECPVCKVLMIIKYQLGDGGIKRIESPEICQSCNTQLSQEDIVNHICEKDEDLNDL